MQGFFSVGLTELPDLEEFLQSFYPKMSRDRYNLEEVLAFLDISRARRSVWAYLPPDADAPETGELFQQLMAYVRRRLAIPRNVVCELHRNLIATLAPRDSIVTVNYDLVVDQALAPLERPNVPPPHNLQSRLGKLSGLLGELRYQGEALPALMPIEQEHGFYLKLHGSLDWLFCPTPGCQNNVRFYPAAVSRFAEGQEEGRPCRLCGTALNTYLIPPVATKRLDDRGRMALLWNLALREIAGAARLVVVGLSFAPGDFELRWLLREALLVRRSRQIDLHIVNPSLDDYQRATDVVPRRPARVSHYRTVDEYLERSAGRA
jgi:hypothetical protein